MQNSELAKIIHQFSADHGIKPATVGSRAAGDYALYERLKNGGSCSDEKKQRILDWIRARCEKSGKDVPFAACPSCGALHCKSPEVQEASNEEA